MANSTVKFDTRELERALKQYASVSKKSLSEIVNQKAFFMARGACRKSYRAQKGKIETELGKDADLVKQISRGKNAGKFKRIGFSIKNNSLANAILRARIHAKGAPQPPASELLGRIRKFIAARAAAAAFIASGWIPAIRFFESRVKSKTGAPPRDPAVKARTGRPMGGAVEAQPGWNPKAVLWNSAVAQKSHNQSESLNKVAGDALAVAMADEVRSMKEYVAKKLQGDANMHSTKKF